MVAGSSSQHWQGLDILPRLGRGQGGAAIFHTVNPGARVVSIPI